MRVARPLLAIAVCLVLAGLADEWALRTWQRCGAPGDTAAEVVAFGEPVLEHQARSADPRSRGYYRSQVAVVRPCLGPRAGEALASRVLLGPLPSGNLELRRGMLVQVSVGDGTADAKLLKPPLRYRWGLVALMVVAATLVIAGGRVGARVLAVMVACAVALLAGLVPLLGAGWSPVPTTGLFCIVLLASVFAISGAVDRKAVAAMVGCAVGLTVAAGLLLASSWWLGFSGAETEAARLLEWIEERAGTRYDYAGIMAASLLVAVFGLAMDTAVTVATGIAQVRGARPDLPVAELRAAGRNVAGDVTGTMVLTLAFASLGLRLPVLLLPRVLGLSAAEMVNGEAGASAILHVLVGVVALIVTGQATALAAPSLLVRGAVPAPRPGRRSRWAWVAAAALMGAAVAGGVAWWRWRAARVVALVWSPPSGSVVEPARKALRERRVGDAVLALWTGRERRPDDARLRVELAYVFMSQHWLAQAEREIDGALAAGADDAQAHYVAGVVRAWTNRRDDARRHLRRATALDPGHAAARAAYDRLFEEDKP